MDSHSNIRQKVVAAMTVRRRGDLAAELLEFMSDSDRAACGPLFDQFAAEPERDLAMEQLIRQMVASERFSSIAEVHPAWILEYLRGEPPRVVGLILRSLPSKHVRYLLEHLPPMLRERIPNMVESFAVSRPVLDLIRRRFESHFLPMRISRSVASYGFEHLYFLKGDELTELIRETGLMELAIALSGMSAKTLHMIYNRLELRDAKRLQRRIKELPRISTDLYRQARMNLLEIEGRHEGSERMLASVGLAALASSAGVADERLIRLIQQKLPPADGYLLKRFVDERKLRTSEPIAAERRKMIEDIVGGLAQEGRISPQWRSFGQGHDAEPEQQPDEETATMKQME
ncbi:MAG: FliG C-terminal domain-containing protein [bacterium]